MKEGRKPEYPEKTPDDELQLNWSPIPDVVAVGWLLNVPATCKCTVLGAATLR